jgi:hypothetical protein
MINYYNIEVYKNNQIPYDLLYNNLKCKFYQTQHIITIEDLLSGVIISS